MIPWADIGTLYSNADDAAGLVWLVGVWDNSTLPKRDAHSEVGG